MRCNVVAIGTELLLGQINDTNSAWMGEQLAAAGIDVTLINPGPYNTGFNDRMAASMWEWFGAGSISAPATDMLRTIGTMVTTNQLDPVDVANKLVELVEADTTQENNFMPPEIRELIKAQIA